METKTMLVKAKVQWHRRRSLYYAVLLESCLDLALKKKLQRKMNYHTNRLKELA